MSERILSVLVEDKPGVLARISSTISRRGSGQESLLWAILNRRPTGGPYIAL